MGVSDRYHEHDSRTGTRVYDCIPYTAWDGQMRYSPWACFYNRHGLIRLAREHVGPWRVPALVPGSVVRVTLEDRRVTFNVDGQDQHTVTLPEDWGNISLAVTLTNSKVTLLP